MPLAIPLVVLAVVTAATAPLGGAPLLLAGGCFAAAALGAALSHPQYVTPAVVFLLFLDVPGVLVREYAAPSAVAALTIALLFIPVADLVAGGERLRMGWPLGLVAAYFLAQFTSALLSQEPGTALAELPPFLFEGLLLTFLVLNSIRSVATLERALWAILLAGGLLGAVSIFQQMTGTYDRPYGGFALVPVEYLRGLDTQARLSGPLGDPNYYAQILVTVIPIGLIMLGSGSVRRRVVAASATTAALGGIVLTYSRGAILALGVILVMALVFRLLKGSHALLVLAVVGVGVAVVPDYRDRVLSIGESITGATEEKGSSEAADQAVRGRTGEMAAAALVFADHPVLGVGPGAFPLYYQEYVQRAGLEAHTRSRVGPDRGEEPRREAHNILLSIAAEIGLAGLAVFLAIVGSAVFRLSRTRRRAASVDPRLSRVATALLLSLLGYLTTGLFLTLAFERYFWALIALCGVAVALDRGGVRRNDRPRGRRVALVR
jgi:O-antigen ligase